MKIIVKKLSALSFAAILLLAGCGAHQQNDIDLSVDPATTTTSENNKQSDKSDITTPEETAEQTTEPEESFINCFIAPDTEYWIEILNSYDCEPGYLYIKESGSAKNRLLLDRKFKDGIGDYQTSKTYYGVTEENELLKVDKSDGSYEILYTAQYGDISDFSSSDYLEDAVPKYFYLVDGEYIIQLETEIWEYTTPVHSDNGIRWLHGANSDLQEIKDEYLEEAYVCEECGNGDYIVWADNDYNYFWYHPETGENEPVVVGEGASDWYFLQVN